MNNATFQSTSHAIPVPEESHPEGPDQGPRQDRLQDEDLSEVTAQLDQIHLSPRAATIRAIMNYAHKQDEAVH
jgi:hypothetical protein